MERVIISDEDKNLNFSLIVSNNKALNAHQNAKEGAIFEESIESKKIMGEISNHIALNTGAALIIDYGYDIKPEIRQSNQYNDTLQAIKNHRYINIFEEVGEADLTSHIDFDALKKSINSDVKIFGAITQRNLLLACGIDMRLKSLQKSNPDSF
jgi:SAM-dependent MidA family methyltransferase